MCSRIHELKALFWVQLAFVSNSSLYYLKDLFVMWINLDIFKFNVLFTSQNLNQTVIAKSCAFIWGHDILV